MSRVGFYCWAVGTLIETRRQLTRSDNLSGSLSRRNEVFCDSEENLVGLLVHLNFSFSGA